MMLTLMRIARHFVIFIARDPCVNDKSRQKIVMHFGYSLMCFLSLILR
jgi:hypothetical protein